MTYIVKMLEKYSNCIHRENNLDIFAALGCLNCKCKQTKCQDQQLPLESPPKCLVRQHQMRCRRCYVKGCLRGQKWSERPCRESFGPFTTVKQAQLRGQQQDRWATWESVFLLVGKTWGLGVKLHLSHIARFHSAALKACQNHVKINSAAWHVSAQFVCFLIFLCQFTTDLQLQNCRFSSF